MKLRISSFIPSQFPTQRAPLFFYLKHSSFLHTFVNMSTFSDVVRELDYERDHLKLKINILLNKIKVSNPCKYESSKECIESWLHQIDLVNENISKKCSISGIPMTSEDRLSDMQNENLYRDRILKVIEALAACMYRADNGIKCGRYPIQNLTAPAKYALKKSSTPALITDSNSKNKPYLPQVPTVQGTTTAGSIDDKSSERLTSPSSPTILMAEKEEGLNTTTTKKPVVSTPRPIDREEETNIIMSPPSIINAMKPVDTINRSPEPMRNTANVFTKSKKKNYNNIRSNMPNKANSDIAFTTAWLRMNYFITFLRVLVIPLLMSLSSISGYLFSLMNLNSASFNMRSAF